MTQLFANNAYGVLAGTVNGAATLLVLVSGQGARFPTPTNGDHFLATLVGLDANGAENAWEIVKCTGRATDQLTVVRAQESTIATTWNAGTRIELRWTKAGVDGKEDAGVAAALDTSHTSAPNPHPQYATAAEAAAAAPVQSVAGKTGAVTLAKADVGLGSVDNTSDVNKPVSNAQQTALDTKQASLVSGTNIKTINSTSLLGSGNIATGDVTLTGTQTLTNKTIVAGTFTNGYTEGVFAVSGTTPALSPTNGSIQTWTLTGNSTPTQGTWANGQSVTLLIDDGTAFTINWSSLGVVWKTNGGSAPTLQTTGVTVIQLWEVGNVIYGARVGDA